MQEPSAFLCVEVLVLKTASADFAVRRSHLDFVWANEWRSIWFGGTEGELRGSVPSWLVLLIEPRRLLSSRQAVLGDFCLVFGKYC